jgi:S-(hydroxymethyl)glutathione dehydrogenase/alcohol dehydrogenase
MRAAVMTAVNEPLRVEQVAPADLGANEVLVRIAASGVCHSDLLFHQGVVPVTPPLVLGHEGAGVVEEVGSHVRPLAPGDRVICSWVGACGNCFHCARGESHLCVGLAGAAVEPKLRRADGGLASRMLGVGTFAEAAVVDERALVKVETDLPDEQLALIGCGVTTGVGAALNTAVVEPGSSVAVFGCGGVGQSVIQGARIAGAARIVAVDPMEPKRTMALELGATDAIDPTAGEPVEQLQSLTQGRGVDYAFEVAGLAQTLEPAYRSVRRGGALVFVGMPPGDVRPPWGVFDQIISEKRVLGCFYGSAQMRRDVPRLVRLAEAGRLDVGALVSRRITLDEVNEALAALERGEVIRSVILNSGGG